MKHPIGDALRLTMVIATMAIALPARAADLTVSMHKVTPDGTAADLGTIVVVNSEAGITLKLNLHGLPPGPHGFHVHENGNCSPILMNGTRIPGGAAGSHLDPDHTYKHEGPTGEGHLGDLPVLIAEADGTATQTLTAPRIKDIEILKQRALIIHTGGDTYADLPNPLGGGGGRFACGVIE